MGGEVSRASGVQLPQHPLEQREAFSIFRATLPTPPHDAVTVFRSEQPSASTPSLDKCAQNLMKYRHPYIMKYIWHWQQRGIHHLATEPIQSLTQVLSSQDTLQICMGLHQIVQALDFLHDKASQSHNNICIDSIYVVSDGTWKLGNMEFLQPFTAMNSSYLKKIKIHRFSKAVDKNEDSIDDFTKIDQFAFSTLVHDVFIGRNEDDIPHLKSFKAYCIQELQNPIASSRPKFSTILNHEFFNQEFISIHKFLICLPVKTENEKKQFFSTLLEKLRLFNEETVAKQLTIPLLSRLVLLNSTARDKLLPYILTPKDDTSNSQGLFTLKTFKQHVTPHLIKMFKVRDIVVRLLLLKHFYGYMMTFDEHDLTNFILPDLLLGIKDTDDNLVSMTLYCLADLVPILGASTVISAKRCKLFTDGRPLSHQNKESTTKLPKSKEDSTSVDFPTKNIIPLTNIATDERKLSLDISNMSSTNPILNSTTDANSYGSRESIELESNLFLHERPSPDGGEDLGDEIVQKPIENHLEDSDENWSDWEENADNENMLLNEMGSSEIIQINEFSNTIKESYINNSVAFENIEDQKPELVKQSKETQNNYSKNNTSFLQKAAIDAKTKKLTDISELDIKNQKYTISKDNDSNKDEFDFFTDMEPVIEKASVLNINNAEKNGIISVNEFKNNDSDQQISSKLNFIPVENDQSSVDAGAWGDVNWEED